MEIVKLEKCPYCGKPYRLYDRIILFDGKKRISYSCWHCGMPFRIVLPTAMRTEWELVLLGKKRKRWVLMNEDKGKYIELERVKDFISPIKR